MPKPRKCGTCTACCQGTGLAVEPVRKERWGTCDHLIDVGHKRLCGIYDERPKGCRDFECLWLQGLIDAMHRPDRCGLMFSATAASDVFVADGQGVRQAAVAYEVWPGAATTGDGFHLIQMLSKRVLVILRRPDGMVLYGPPAVVAQAQRAMLLKKNEGASHAD